MRILRTLVVVGIPLIAAAMAAFGALVWVFGIPGDWSAGYVPGWIVGGIAIAVYLHAYALYAVAAIVVLLAKWRLIGLLHGFIWICLAAFLAAMAVSITMIAAAG